MNFLEMCRAKAREVTWAEEEKGLTDYEVGLVRFWRAVEELWASLDLISDHPGFVWRRTAKMAPPSICNILLADGKEILRVTGEVFPEGNYVFKFLSLGLTRDKQIAAFSDVKFLNEELENVATYLVPWFK